MSSPNEDDATRGAHEPPTRDRRSPYTVVFVVLAALLPSLLIAHVVALFVAVPAPSAVCAHEVTLAPSAWPTDHAQAVDRCVDELTRLEASVALHRPWLDRLRVANLRRCVLRARSLGDFESCIEGLNGDWSEQLLRWP